MLVGGKSLRTFGLIAGFVTMLLTQLFLFQNCAGAGGDDANLFSNLDLDISKQSEECISTLVNCEPNPEFLQLQIQSPHPYLIPSGTVRADVSGLCNDGDYPNHKIRWKLTNMNTGQSTDYFYDKLGCLEGKFVVNINTGHTVSIISKGTRLDSNGNSVEYYIYKNIDFEVTVEIRGVDQNGTEIFNPRGQHRDIITLRFM